MEIKGRNIAGHDDADAQYQLYFDCRDRGENVECIKWLRKAARNGLPDAEYEMGFVYEDGNFVRRSFRKAVEWYRKAAEHGIPEAWVNLGHCYHYGKGVVRDCREAVKLYRKGARMDDALAFYNLGVCYDRGEGGKAVRRESCLLVQARGGTWRCQGAVQSWCVSDQWDWMRGECEGGCRLVPKSGKARR